MPPAELRFMGASDEEFARVGDRVVRSLRELAGLEPAESVLEIGCGYGRVAHALLRSGHAGPYTGMDILPRHVEWCASNI